MRILLVSHRYSPDIGGIEEIVSRQAKALSQKGNEVRVVTTTNDEVMIGERIENGVKVNRFPGYAPNNAYYFSRKMSVYLKNITKNYDLIHAHNYHAFPAFYAFRNKNSTPFILSAHYHGGSRNKFRNRLGLTLLSRRMVETSRSSLCVFQHSEKEKMERDFSLPPICKSQCCELNCHATCPSTEICSWPIGEFKKMWIWSYELFGRLGAGGA